MTRRRAAIAVALLASLPVAAAHAAARQAGPAQAAVRPVPAGLARAAAAPMPGGACALAVTVKTPTLNAAALERLGVVRAVAGHRVRDVHVMLKRHGRLVADGSRGGPFTGTRAVRLAFARRARPGGYSLLVTGRRAGCAAKLETRRTIALDSRDLPVTVRSADVDLSDGDFAVTLRRTGSHAVSDLRVRVFDARGVAVAERTLAAPLGEPARIAFAPARTLAPGRYGLLVTGTVRGEQGRSAIARSLDLEAESPAPAGTADGTPPPPAGAVVQQVSVSWSGGRWQGADSAGFAIPGIGEGQLVCRPDTQWIRVFPSDRSRDVAMMLWTSRDWETGSEVALREALMTPFTGPDFNEGLNKFTPPEKRSHGTFEGVVGDGLPLAGTFGMGRAPTEVRLSWSWDFEDPADARCSIAATFTSQGPGTAGPIARGLTLAWNGESGVPADTTLATPVPGVGTVRLRCDPRPEGVRQLVVAPDAALPGLALTTYEGSDRSDRALGDVPYVIPLPNSGLVEATAPSGPALRLVLASRWKVNDPEPAQNFCRLSGIVVAGLGAGP